MILTYSLDHTAFVAIEFERHLVREGTFLSDNLTQGNTAFLSTVHGTSHSRSTLATPQYWAQNLASPVLFSSAVQSFLGTAPMDTLFLEIGPHSALSAPLKQICTAMGRSIEYISAQTRHKDASASFLTATGKLWQESAVSDLSSLFKHGKCISGLPSYAWDDGSLATQSPSAANIDDTDFARLSASEKRERVLRNTVDSSEFAENKAPITDMGIILRYLWVQTLKSVIDVELDKIGMNHSFFLLGGDSITTIELSTLAYSFGIRLTPLDILSHSTLADMASVALIEDRVDNSEIRPFSLLPQNTIEKMKAQFKEKCHLSPGQLVEDIYPCTSLQEGFMALGTKQPGSYIHRQAYRLAEDVDLELFRAAWDETMARCGSLRSRIILIGGQTLQAAIKEEDAWERPEHGVDVYAYVDATRSIPMTYGDRLSRYAIIQHADGSNYLVWLLHHAIFDGLTMKIVLDEVYNVYRGKATMTLRPYATFIQYVESLDPASSRKYWKTQLSGARKAAFPSGQVTAQSQDLGRVMKKTIPCRNEKASLGHITTAAVLRAAWAILLAKYCETDDVCFGTTLSGRQAPVPGLNQVAGPMISTVPVRVKLDKRQKVSDFLDSVQSHAGDLVPHEQYGLQSISKLSEDAQEVCDFSNLLVIQPMQHLSSIAENASDRIIYQGDAERALSEEAMRNYFNYPLVLQARILEHEVELDLTYYSDLISEVRLEALCHHFDHIVQQLLDPLDRVLGDVSVSSAWDLEYAINVSGEIPTIVSSCVHEMVADQAKRRPHAPAIHAWDKRLTYRELDSASDRLAHHIIRKYAVKRHDLIHVCFEKSAWYFVAILAINKAGAAWVPLDPSHPEQRLRQVVSQTKASLILSSPANAALSSNLISSVVEVSENLDKRLMKTAPITGGPRIKVDTGDVAYILFTSGSTGTPKGLVMEHGSACTSQTAAAKRLKMPQDVRMLQFAAFVFDLSIGEILGPWSVGGCLCVPSEESRMNDLPSFIRSAEVNWAYLTPSFSRTLDPALVPGLQLLLFAGEAVGKDALDKWFGKLRLINGWGPAETCCFSTLWEWTSRDQSPLTVGRPVGGLCWIVDPEDPEKLAPTGTFGEVVIQGPTVLREYLADPENTKASIMQKLPGWTSKSPMTGPGAQRIFKSGDLCRYNPDGTIEFGARKDKQVKIRGLRVELGEVEHHIRSSLEGVKQVAVDMMTAEAGSQLVAYFSFSEETRSAAEVDKSVLATMTEEAQTRVSKMLGELRVALPRYMIPTLFIPCKYMPFITSTKLDLKLLKELASKLSKDNLASYALVDSKKRPPETEMEKRMQALWATQLELDAQDIGLDDSFLHLGGDSIAAIYLVSTAREAGISFAVKDVFDDPRLFKVAAAAVSVSTETEDRIEPFGLLSPSHIDFVQSLAGRRRFGLDDHHVVEDAYPCTSLQEGLMALTAKQKGSYVSTYVHRLPKRIDRSRFKDAWNVAVEACTNMRTRIAVEDGTTIQAVIGNDNAWENTENMSLEPFLAKLKTLDVGFGTRLCRFALLESDPTYFIWLIHHAINDGWSMRIVLDTAYRAYNNLGLGRISPYTNFIKYVTGGLRDSSAGAYWQAELEGAGQTIFPQTSSPAHSTDNVVRVVDKTVSFTGATDASITMATVLRTAWALVLARYTDSKDVTYGATISGRQAPISGLLTTPGAVIATVPIRVQLRSDRPVTELLRKVQAQASQMVPYEQYGLPNISKLSPSARKACDFSSLLVIQPKEQTSSVFNPKDGLLMSGDEEDHLLIESLNHYFNYPLVMLSYMSTDHVTQRFLYNPNVLSELRVEAISEHFDHVVQQLLTRDGNLPLSSISLVGDWDVQHAISSCQLRESTQSCTHWLIQQHVRERPDEEAIVSWDGDLTYRQLNMYASRLAALLQKAGVGPEVLVPLCFPKSTWTVVAMVAVQMAGGAFIALDPTAPQARLRGIVEDAKARIVVAPPSCNETAQSLGVDHVILVDEQLLLEVPDPVEPISSSAGPSNASVVLFTSGSTGKPKGMVIQHDTICSTSNAYGADLGITLGTRVFNFSSYTFDLGILDVLVTLMRGGCLCVPSEHARMNDLAGAMNAMRAEWVFLTPTVGNLLDPSEVTTLKYLTLGGEAVTKKSTDRWRDSSVTLYAIYGPAEASLAAWNPTIAETSRSANMGRPLSGAFWVVDPEDFKTLVPVGCVGELVIQGPLLARGYINAAPEQEANWIRDASWFPQVSGTMSSRAYRTGDLVRRNADGTFDYVGRKDTQVKLHGQRVELGEIEAQVYQHLPKQLSTMVDVIKDEDGRESLLAFIWSNANPSSPFLPNGVSHVSPSDELPIGWTLLDTVESQTKAMISYLDESLSAVLPSYMVPSAYLIFRGKPVQTTSGKIDRKAILRHAHSLSLQERLRFSPGASESEPPTTEMELKLRDLWVEVLNLEKERVGKHDNFLRLGGDSVIAIKLVSLAQRRGLVLTVANIFGHPRLSDMALAITEEADTSLEEAKPFSLLEGDHVDSMLKTVRQRCNLPDASTIEDLFPCTKFQEAMMALAIQIPGSYISKQIVKLPEHIDTAKFKSAWEETVSHCPNLRTRILLIGGTLLQALVKEPVIWEDTNGVDIQSYLQRTNSFTIGHGTPLSRFALVEDRTRKTRYFICVSHHSIFDGWTLRIALDTLTRIYHGKTPSVLQSYAGFIKYVSEIDAAKAGEYWREQLLGAQPATFPPPLRHGHQTKNKTSLVFTRTIPSPRTSDFSLTKATVLRATWALLMARYCDTDDVTFGVAVSGRHAPVSGLETMSGPAVTSVPIRIRIDKTQSIEQFLLDCQTQASEMITYEQFGLQNIARSSPDSQAACNFSNMLVVQPGQQFSPATSAPPGEVGFEMMQDYGDLLEGTMQNYFNYPLTLQCTMDNDSIELMFVYESGRLATKELEMLSHQFEHVFSQFLSGSAKDIGSVSVASPSDIEQAISWNKEFGVPDIVDDCAHELIAGHAKLYPDAPAVHSWDVSWTYAELDQLANLISHHLVKDFQVQTEDLVHVCCEKSGWFIAAILAINKAGAAWVPIDPSQPSQRHQQVVSQTKSRLILHSSETKTKSIGLVADAVEIGPSLIDELKARSYDNKNPARQVSWQNIAYVIFTSGSTGVPKGIVMEHGALCTSETASGKRMGVHRGVRMLQFSSYVFDVMLGEIFSTLFGGGCVCIPSEDARMNNLAAYIRDSAVNWAMLTPLLTKTMEPTDVPGLELLILGGEAMGQEVIDKWSRHVRFMAGWGPAETIVSTTIHEWRPEDTSSPQTIGRPVGGSCWIVDPDDSQRLAPIGCLGEIVIQGPTLMRHYLDDTEKTATAIVSTLPDWAPQPDDTHWGRFYKTGDMASYNADGTIRFASRKDTQVKIRGYRVELGEIEHHIRDLLPGIEQVAVNTLEQDNGTALVSYISFSTERRVLATSTESEDSDVFAPMTPNLQRTLTDLVAELGNRVPQYMLPTLFVPCHFMPLTTSGKLDFKLLRHLTADLQTQDRSAYALTEAEKRAPETDMERRLQALWSTLLKIPLESIGRDDSFLQVGGDSISMIQFASMAREENLEISVSDIFNDPRLSSVASKVVETNPEAALASSAIPPFSLLDEYQATYIHSDKAKEICQLSSQDIIEDAYGCSKLQEGFMALSVKQKGSYIAKNVFEIPSHVDLDRFKGAWEMTVAKVPVLRTRIITLNGASLQLVVKDDIKWDTLFDLPLNSYLKSTRDIEMGFGSRLCRYGLARAENGKAYFILTMHHAVHDGWTIRVLQDLLGVCYRGLETQPPQQYSRFIQYTLDLQSEESKLYWLESLQGAKRASFPPAMPVNLSSSQTATRMLTKKLAVNQTPSASVTKATLLRAAWAIVLARYTDSDDVCFGGSISGRQAPVPGILEMPGPVVATVPIRSRVNPTQTVSSFLDDVQRQASDSIPHEQYGLQNIGKLAEDIKDACDFSSLLVIQPMQHLSPSNDSNTLLLPAELEGQESLMENYFSYPLIIQGHIYEDHINLVLVYMSQILAEPQANALTAQFEHVLAQLVEAGPEATLSSISVAGEYDLERAIDFNGPRPELIESCIHRLVKIKALQQPNAPAIKAWDAQFTYAELDALGDQLANYLVAEYGIRPEDLVHVCFEKSAWFFVSILAINKAGAAWVPLEPSHPEQRQRQVVQQTLAKLALTSASNAKLCSTLVPRVLEVSAALAGRLKADKSLSKQMDAASPSNAAYVLFTSGSTGTPKGLVMEHRSVCTSQTTISKRLGMSSNTRMLQFAAYVFDLAILEIVAPLVSGSCVVVPSDHVRMNDLKNFIRDEGVNMAGFTPSLARTLNPSDLPGLKKLILTGEAVPRDVFDSWYGKVTLLNGWGPAETCVFSSLHTWSAATESPMNIGQSIGGYCWIVDAQDPLKLAPIGTVGEIIIQGPTIMREYLADPVKTKEKVMDSVPLWAPNRDKLHWNRCFRSGDLGVYNPDGTIEFVSRKDTQVKIHGLRVELGEIEHHLQQALTSAKRVVVDVLHVKEGVQLLAYFSQTDETRVTSSTNFNAADSPFMELNDGLKAQLAEARGHLGVNVPRYMVPSFFIPCKYMPVITSSKLDRNELRRQAATLSRVELSAFSLDSSAKRSPEGEAEHRMAAVWSELLDIPVEQIGRDDSFLALGGDSITAIQLVSALREDGLSLTVNDIFRDSRLSAVARSVSADRANSAEAAIEPFSLLDTSIWPTAPISDTRQQCSLASDQQIEDILPVTKFQEGLMALAAKQPGSYIAKHVFKLPRSVNTTLFKQAWEDTVQMCSALRTRIVVIDDEPAQVLTQGPVEWETEYDGLNISDAISLMQNIQMAYGSPLNRFALLKDAEDRSFFVWISHHAVHDGWTMRLILSTFQNLYRNVETPRLGQYAKFISYVANIDQTRATEYWSNSLRGASQATFPPAATSSTRSGLVKLVKSNIDVADKKGSSITRATIMRAAWAMVLARYSDTNDVSLGTTLSGRQAPVPGLLEMTGPVVATVPVRCQIDKTQTVQDYLQRVQAQASEMVEFEQFGLQSIEKVHSDAKDACRFNSLLVIQPISHLIPGEVGSSENLLTPVHDGDDASLQNYFSYPLVTQCHLYDTHVELVLIYNSAILSDLQMEALGQHFKTAVGQLDRQDETRLGDVSLAGPWDLTKAVAWKGEEPELIDACFHDLVDKHTKLTPNSKAIEAWDRSFTYSELSKASNRLANYLVEHLNLKLGEYVHVCFEKSAWHFVSILAINKAGGTWVPLDPSHPVSRLKQIVSRTGARLCLSSGTNTGLCAQLLPETLVVSPWLDEKLEQHGYRSDRGPSRTIPTSTAAYVLFTSGSTGLPKGLVMEHRSLCTSQTASAKRLGLTPDVRMLQFAAFVFDLSIGEIAATLLSGACLCIPSEHDRMNDLPGFIRRFRVFWAFLTPSYARTLSPAEVPTVKLLLLAGEAVDRDVFNSWFGRVRLVNGWGPAEACCFSSMREWKAAEESSLSVGEAVGGYCWIVDPDNHHKLAPIGCIGEVMVQSPTILREYLSDQGRTKAVVALDVPAWAPKRSHPRWNRFFKTGDLCYYNEQGQMIFVSRKDTQVKIRGLRVELSEVEHHLRGCLKAAKQVIVDVVKTDAGPKLTCFFSEGLETRMGSGEDLFLPLSGDLQKAVASAVGKLNVSLPRYMVPTLYVPCSYLPSITSTKIDRKRLRSLMQRLDETQLLAYALHDAGQSAPETEMELRLQEIWSQLLNLNQDSIGRDDSFLQLGGDSITVIRLVKVARESGIVVTVKDVFDDPRLCEVAAAAELLDEFEVSHDTAPGPFSLLSHGLDETSVLTALGTQYGLPDRLEVEDAFPCTGLQEGLMALTEKQPGSYIAKNVYRLPSNIDIPLFKEAWRRTVEHCANLRTRFVQVKGSTLQIVVQNDFQWEEDVSDLASYRARTKSDSMGYGTRLCRYFVTRESDGTGLFVFDIHHTIFDGWTLPLIMGTLTSAYRGLSLPRLQPYTSFIKYVSNLDHNAASAYWSSYLADAGKATFPPAKDTIVQSSDSSSAVRTGVLQKTIALPSMSPSITKASLLRGAWGLVLAQYSGLDDVTFGATVSGRQAPIHGVDEIPGLVIATVPVRIRVKGHQTAERYLQSIQADSSKMVAHEQLGLQLISKASPAAREACDFNSLLVIQPVDHITSTSSDADAVLLPPESDDIDTQELVQNYFSYPLVVQCHLLQDSIRLVFIYDMDVLPAHTMEAVSHHVEHVIHQLSEPKTTVGSISAAGPWDMERFVSTNGKVGEVVDNCVHHLFEEQVKQRPGVIAVEGWDRNFTYAELNAAANRLAHYLVKTHGVQLDDLIPICFDKSAWYVVSMIAVLKAGAAWVPLDPQHPQQRHQQILEKTQAKLLLASETTAAMCSKLEPKMITVSPALDDKLSADANLNLLTPAANPSPDNAAFVLFTSGSTGVPKALVMQHRPVCTSQHQIRQRFGLSPQTRMLQFSAHVFDVCCSETVCTLLSGGQICIPSEDIKMNDVSSFIRERNVNFAILTPSFVRTLKPEDIPQLENLALAGEAISRDVFEGWFGKVRRLFNAWGPAEGCMISTIHEYRSSDESPLTIGHPLGSYAWLVDPKDHSRLSPIGTVGEIVIQGPTLLREYLRDPERTEQSVVTKLPAWAPRQGEKRWGRMYKTGDVGRYNPDGTIEFVSRKDTQVKIRGLRVELGEVEYHLQATVPAVRQVVVDVYKSDAGSSLVAYLCFSDARELSTGVRKASIKGPFVQLDNNLRQQLAATVQDLAARLPRYMIPSKFIPCSYMPIVTSGKVDRKEIRRLTAELNDQALSSYSLSSGLKRAPSTPHERKLQAIWAQTLSREPESIFNDDSFFDLGGDSIMAIQAVSIARDAGLLIRVQDTFKDPRLCAVAGKADAIDVGVTDESEIEPFSLLSDSLLSATQRSDFKQQCGLSSDQTIEDAFPSTPFQEGLMTLSVKQPGSYTAKYIYRLPDSISLTRFQTAWEETVSICTNLRTRIVLLENTSVQVIIKDDVHWELANQSTSLKAAMQAMGTRKMTYGTRLCRYSLVSDAASGGKFFIWSIHHAVFDGWTIRLVLTALHQAYARQEVTPLEPYAGFIQYLQRIDQTAAGEYWRKQLGNAKRARFPPPLKVSMTGKKQGGDATTRNIIVTVDVPSTTNPAITKATFVRAAWAIVLSRYCNSTDVTFGSSISGRQAPIRGVLDMPGPAIATVPVRIQLDRNQAALEYVQSVQNQASEMVPFEQYGLQNIAKLGADIQEACDFTSLLVVQPRQHLDQAGETGGAEKLLTFVEGEEGGDGLDDYFSYPLIVQGHLESDSITITLTYHVSVLSESTMKALSQQLSHVIRHLIIKAGS
jgi:amino acid adenylation domain-containing protein